MPTTPQNSVVGELLLLRRDISELDFKVRRARNAVKSLKFLGISTPISLVAMWLITAAIGSSYDMAPYWPFVSVYSVAAVISCIVIILFNADNKDVLEVRR